MHGRPSAVPPAFTHSFTDMLLILLRHHRLRSLVPYLIAEKARRSNVPSNILPTILACLKVFSRALEVTSLLDGNPVLLGE